jgi:hypothetical protein
MVRIPSLGSTAVSAPTALAQSGVSEDSPCKYSSAGTNPAGTLIIAEPSLGRIGVILDYVEGAGHGDLLTDVLKSIRWV